MHLRRISTTLAAAAVVGTIAIAGGGPASAHTTATPTGTRSLAAVLAADGSGFDRNWSDYDIVDNAVHAVLTAKPHSPVTVLADGTVPLTAFLPTDYAFARLAHDLTGRWYGSERAVFAVVASLGISTVETVLLYHVVPGATITYRAAQQSNGAQLTTAQGGSITVHVRYCWIVRLGDNDPDAPDPTVVRPDINRGNAQIAHGISRVLRPVDL